MIKQMVKTFKCDYCGATFSRDERNVVSKHVCCSRSCARKLEAFKRRERGENHRPQRKGALPHEDVRVKVTKMIDLYPDYMPAVGQIYDAEKYHLVGREHLVGYVISVNGHRINIRKDECVEV